MRIVVLTLAGLTAFTGCAAQGPADTVRAPTSQPADAAFAALEGRLVAAPHVSFHVVTTGTGETAGSGEDATPRGHRLSGTFAFGPGGWLAVASEGEVNGLGAAPGLVSDGTTMRGGRGGADAEWPDVEDAPVPADLRAVVVAQILQRGAADALFTLVGGNPLGLTEDPELGEPIDLHPAGGVSWGEDAVVGGRPAHALRFRLPDGEVTLWLDAETGLPLRRVETRADGAGPMRITEDYTGWSFEATAD